MPIKYKYTPEMPAEAAAKSLGVTEVLRRLGVTVAGGAHAHISRRLKRFGIDTSHFPGRAHHGEAARPASVAGPDPPRVPIRLSQDQAPVLHRVLREVGVPYRCEGCKIGGSGRVGLRPCTSATSMATDPTTE
ncbi:hypothetical protein [Streptosporangium sandarakinum]